MKIYYHKTQVIKMKRSLFILLILAYFSHATNAQPQRSKVTPADFEKWGTLSGEEISPDGKWVMCRMEYQSGRDTLFVINSRSAMTFNFPGALSATFSPMTDKIAIAFPNEKMQIINLTNGKVKFHSSILRFDFLSGGGYLMMYEESSEKSTIQLFDSDEKLIWQLHNVSDYSIGKGEKLAMITESKVLLLDLSGKKLTPEIISDTTSNASRLVWSRSGKSFAFFTKTHDGTSDIKIAHYALNTKTLQMLGSNKLYFDNTAYGISPYRLAISDDDRWLYFNVVSENKQAEKSKLVEVWDSSTFLEYPLQELNKDPEMNLSLTSWNIQSGALHKIDREEFFNSKILPGGKYVYSQLRSSIIARNDEIPPADYYITTMEGKQKNIVVSQGSQSAGAIVVSPSGRFVSYFRDGNFYIYDNDKNKSANLTGKTNVNFKNFEYDNAGANPGYRSPGYTSDSKYLIVYDQYDIWLFSVDGINAKKITNGRKSKTQFRIAEVSKEMLSENFAIFRHSYIDLKKDLILTALGFDKSSGYYTYSEKYGLVKLNYGKYKADRIAKARSADVYLYTEETDINPPRLMITSSATKTSQKVFQSNKHYTNYEWPHSELISYENSNSVKLQGILMYPSGYEKGKKYPMVVYLYEKLSSLLYEYKNPVSAHHIGFDPMTYLLDGYIVLMPDIVYEVGNPAVSATDCVTAAVKSIAASGIVEENHIGIVGHSFGAFQVSFIITQTPIFAVAVAGSGITDPVSWYLTMNNYTGRSNSWRFESQQLRMGSSPFNNWNGYIRNSAIAHASNISTPLLNWSGKADRSVNPEQSIEMHLALRRLQKPNRLLLYPGQGHILTDYEAKLHLTKSVKEWLDLYLKN
jgi:dipeptidyl aminopeptidase/acylaminoacyl peptidase